MGTTRINPYEEKEIRTAYWCYILLLIKVALGPHHDRPIGAREGRTEQSTLPPYATAGHQNLPQLWESLKVPLFPELNQTCLIGKPVHNALEGG